MLLLFVGHALVARSTQAASNRSQEALGPQPGATRPNTSVLGGRWTIERCSRRRGLQNDRGDLAEWLGSTVEYEGFPLALRVRPRAGTVEHRASLSQLAAITHKLAQVRSNGLPESDYNDSLADLDHSIITSLESLGAGVTVIVETFAGKRTYYAYVISAEHADRALADVKHRFHEHDLSLEVRADARWGLYEKYRSLFPW
jgi:hypothetical protein